MLTSRTGRKVLLGLILVCMTGAASSALALENLGIIGGISGTSLEGDQPRDFSFDPGAGFAAGALFEFALADDVLLSLQPGYLYSRTDIVYKDRFAGVERDSLSLDVGWVVLPVLARIFSDTGTLFATGGFDLAWVVGGNFGDGQVDEPASSILRNLDVAAIVGAGVSLPVGRYRITGEVRYRQGLINSAKNDQEEDEALPKRFRFAGFQFQAGLILPLGGP